MNKTTTDGWMRSGLYQKGDKMEKFKKWAEQRVHEQSLKDAVANISWDDPPRLRRMDLSSITYGHSHSSDMLIPSGSIPMPSQHNVEYTFQDDPGTGMLLSVSNGNDLRWPDPPTPIIQEDDE